MKNQYIAQYLFLLIIFVTGSIYAQAPTVTSFSPATVTQKSVVTITGTNLSAVTAVKFGTATAASFTLVNATTITAVVASGNSGAITVTNASGNGASATSVTYVAPITTPALAAVTRAISNWQGYWSSTAVSSDVAKQPNTHHDLTGFTYNSVVYSTGVDDATLNTKIGTSNYVHADFRALPVNNITGNTGSASFLAMGSLIDGSLTTATYTAPGIAGLHARDVLIDGAKGLDLGTGVTNLSASAVLSFNVNSIVPEKIIDNEPDILITQIAQPSAVTDLYYFTDAAGNIVGNPISVSQSSITAVGTYRLDLFTLATGTAYSTVTPSGSNEVNNVRDIRMIALKLSEFGITSSTAGSITQFKCIPGGDSDTAFTAYNAGAFIIPAPVITVQPVSQVVCTGTGTANFSVTATGSNLTYQWRKNGIDISGATSSSYSVASTAANVATYSVVVTNASGSVISASACLNTIIAAQPAAASVCQGTATTLSVAANGASLGYQWYSNTTASVNGGTLLTGATSSSYLPSVATAGTVYYYCNISNSGVACAAAITTPVAVTVYAPVNAGTVSANQTICYNTTATISLSGYTGTIQWQKSTDNTTWTDVTGATSPTYTTSALTASTYYKAVVTSGTCGSLTSGVTTITVNAESNAGAVSANQSICSNTTATVSITGYTGTIQWQQYADGTAWVNITGATAAAYTTPALTGTKRYRAIVSNSTCTSATGNAVIVTVNAASNAGTISANQTICYGTVATVSVTGSTGSLQWQKSTDETTWANITGATNAAYTTPVLTSTMHYRVVAINNNCSNAVSEMASVFVNDVITWTGQVSTDWNTAGNWACNILPTLNTHVSIPTAAINQPAVHGTTGLAKSLTLDADAKLTILTGGTLKVANAVKVTTGGQLTVQNNGSLIQDNIAQNSGNITVVRNSNSLYRLDYTMWSSPVTGQNLQAFSPQTSAGRFYEYTYAYDPAIQGNREQYAIADPANSFTPGKGYLIRMPNTNDATGYNTGATALTFTGAFTGEPNNGDINYTLSTVGNRYTAVGNPYPSPISVEDFFAQNAGKLDRNSGIYMWRKKNNSLVTSYATLTLAGYTANPSLGGGAEQADYYTSQNSDWLLSQGQGFLVRTAQEPTSTSLSFTNSMRRAAPLSGTQAFLRAGQNSMSRLWLNIVGNDNSFSQAAVAYIDGATLDLDYGYDGAQVNDGGIAIYSLAADTNLAIQARPEFTDNDIVTLGYKATAAGQYTINLDHTDGIFAAGQDIYLKDAVMGVTRNIKNHPYTFTTEEGTFTNRFTIIYSTSALGTDSPELTANNVMVYKEGTSINISTGAATMTGVSVYDIRGRKLYGMDAINSTKTTITDLQSQQQVLIVEIATDKGIVSKKIVF